MIHKLPGLVAVSILLLGLLSSCNSEPRPEANSEPQPERTQPTQAPATVETQSAGPTAGSTTRPRSPDPSPRALQALDPSTPTSAPTTQPAVSPTTSPTTMPALPPASAPTPSPAPPLIATIDETTLGRNLIEHFTETEMSCLKQEAGIETFNALMEQKVLEGDAWWSKLPFPCLAGGRAVDLGVAMMAGLARRSDPEVLDCLRRAFSESGAKAFGYIFGGEFGSEDPMRALSVSLRFTLCVPDETISSLAAQRLKLIGLATPSKLRCMFAEIEVDEYVSFLTGSLQGLATRPTPEFLRLWKSLSAISDSCGVLDFVPPVPVPSADERFMWRYRASSLVLGSPVVADGVVYVTAEDNRLYAVDAAAGKLVWRIELEGNRWLTASGGVVYVSSGDHLYAISADSGDIRWKYFTGRIYDSTPAVAQGFVYVGSWNGSLHAVDAATGDIVWQFDTESGIRSSPAVSEGVVYVLATGGTLYALDAATGGLRWEHQLEGRGHYQSPAVANGVVYVGGGQHLYAVNAATGGLVWRADQRVMSDSRLAIAGEIIYLNTRSGVAAVDTGTGDLLWEYSTDIRATSPTVEDGVVYLGSWNKRLHAVDAATGKSLWQYETADQIYSKPAVASEVVYFGSADDHLYALSVSKGVREATPTLAPAVDTAENYAKIAPNLSNMLGMFGVALATSADGGTIAVGDSMKSSGRKYNGAVYVFTREGGSWTGPGEDASAILLPPDDNDWEPVPTDRDWLELTESFGRAVATSGDGGTIVVGAPEQLPHGYHSGAAYVFTRPTDGWTGVPEVATLTASDGRGLDRFGDSVAISADGETVVVGSPGKSNRSSPGAGYVFSKPAGGWTDSSETAVLTVSEGSINTDIWSAVAVSQDGVTIVMGAPMGFHVGVASGTAYVFIREGPRLVATTETAQLRPSNGAEDNRFGDEIAISDDGSTVVVGSSERDAYGEDHGAAYVFTRPAEGWVDAVESATLSASDGARQNFFGASIEVSAEGDALIVGAPGHAHSRSRAGGAYLFLRPAGGWESATENMELISPVDPPVWAPWAGFGTAVSIANATLVIGAPSRAVYLYTLIPTGP